MTLNLVRVVFVILSMCSGFIVVENLATNPGFSDVLTGLGIGLAIPVVIVAFETILRKYFVEMVSGIMFGLVAGFILSFILIRCLNFLFPESSFLEHVQIPIVLVVCYVCVAIILQTRDKFKFIIPYLDLRSGGSTSDYLILDSSAIIDGRVFKLLKLGIFEEKVIIPQFVVDELQELSDSQDRLKREKGRKALSAVKKIRSETFLNVDIYYDMVEDHEGADAKLVGLGRKINGRIVTKDANLAHVSQIQGIPAINIHDLAIAVRPDLVSGEEFEVEIVKEGEKGKDQGVGFLAEGTMVVVDNAKDRVGEMVRVQITNTVQTTSGWMVFAKPV